MDNRIIALLICITLTSCGGLRTFHDYARAGDTVAVPVGMQPTFNKDNITVTITPSAGSPIVLQSSNPAIRAIINLYPDPVSSMIVSREINEDLTSGAIGYESTTRTSANDDKDWYQTTVFVDIPLLLTNGSSFPDGLTQIEITDAQGNSHTMTLDVIAGTGTANTFLAEIDQFPAPVTLNSSMLDSLSRVPHTVVFIESTGTIPNAIELTLSHDPDESVGGAGKAFIVNPLGYRKNISWHDDGINLKTIITESRNGIIDDMKDYKFYITGTVSNIQLSSIVGYDNNGNEISGITGLLIPN